MHHPNNNKKTLNDDERVSTVRVSKQNKKRSEVKKTTRGVYDADDERPLRHRAPMGMRWACAVKK